MSVGNPFAGYGEIVFGDMHVGRHREVNFINQRVLNTAAPGCVALVGAPRIGKSSLAWHCLKRPDVLRAHPRLVPVWVNLRTVGDETHLLERCVREVYDVLVERDGASSRLGEARRQVAETRGTWEFLLPELFHFFKEVRRLGWRVVLILDEFDYARTGFRDRPAAFDALRELAYNPDWRVGIVTTSRRQLQELVNQAVPEESTFVGIFHQEFLGCFGPAELEELVGRVPESVSLDVTSAADRLRQVTGGHPYLASASLFQLCATIGSASDDASQDERLERAIDDSRFTYLSYYRSVERLLDADGRLGALVEIVHGPQLTATYDDAELLERHGIIKRGPNGVYVAFSAQFQDYLAAVARRIDPWSTWSRTELLLRSVVEGRLALLYGLDWAARVKREKPKLQSIVEACEERRKQEQRGFGPLAASNLTDYAYPRDYAALIFAHWSTFEPLFGKDKRYWEDRFSLLAKARNPMAHNRLNSLNAAVKMTFEGYCRELLDLLENESLGFVED